MPRFFVPPLLRDLTDGQDEIEVDGRTVRGALQHLENSYPGFAGRILEGDALKPGLAIAVDGQVSTMGLSQRVRSDSEIHVLPAIGGG